MELAKNNDVDSDSLYNLSLENFLSSTASSSPTPGGGAVAGVSASFGIALIAMALEVSKGSIATELSHDLESLLARVSVLVDTLKEFPERDIDAFNSYMAALKLPKSSATQLAFRQKTLSERVVDATEVPLNLASSILEAIYLGEEALKYSNRHVVSDIGAGVSILFGALEAVLLNVAINVVSMQSEEKKTFYSERAKILLTKGNDSSRFVLEAVREKVAG